MRALIFFDGGSRHNPGHAGFGVIVQMNGREIEIGRYIGDSKTNNEAEFAGLIVGLKVALDMGATEAVITGDSKLVINTVNGEWFCKKPHLRVLVNEARDLVQMFEQIEWVHVRGHTGHTENERVDELSTNAILYGRSVKKNDNPFTKKAGHIKTEGKIVDPFQ